MVEITLSNETVLLINLAARITKAAIKDCIVEDDRIIYVVESGQLGLAIGRKAENLEKLRTKTKKHIKFVEYNSDLKTFIKNLCKPYSIDDVAIEGRDNDIVRIQAKSRDKSKLIGKGGRNIAMIRTIAQRHHHVKDVQIK